LKKAHCDTRLQRGILLICLDLFSDFRAELRKPRSVASQGVGGDECACFVLERLDLRIVGDDERNRIAVLARRTRRSHMVDHVDDNLSGLVCVLGGRR
jgi:hypothetical protein